MKIDPNTLRLDERRLEFPTDQVSLKSIRERQHVLCSRERLRSIVALELYVFRAHEIELLLAEAAFKRAMGLSDRNLVPNRRALCKELDAIYQDYKISSGWHQSEELVRVMEQSAAGQAEQFRVPER